jgi:catechol 2,3-dioxygenase-like lactoylglutathione lyase family enzyme
VQHAERVPEHLDRRDHLDLDHLVLAGPNLDETVAWFTELTGVRPAPGGSHVGLGTANQLVALGNDAYVELIGPDPTQPEPAGPRPFRIDELDAPRIVGWALRSTDLDALVAQARAGGYDPGDAQAMSRRTPDGALLEWRLTPPRFDYGDGLVPFAIDWGATPHPTSRGLPETPLLEFQGRHPDPASVRPALAALRADLQLSIGELVSMTAVVHGTDGPVTI